MTPEQLRSATGCTEAAALTFTGPLSTAIERWRVQRVAEFLAQIAVESRRLSRLQEDLFYTTPERLMQVWPKRFPTRAFAACYVRDPEKLANYVYAGRMGNGPIESGDGWRYRGRGLKQLTGRDNYSAYQAAAKVSCLDAPDLLLDPIIAADSAGWFWSANGCDALADDTEALTKRINGGLTGYAERMHLTAIARGVFGVA